MKIVDFTRDHAVEAAALSLACYNEERQHVPALPPLHAVPDLTAFADFNLGAAAFENGRMLGFLCFYPPFERAFTTPARGTFSPIHAHGAMKENRGKIYRYLYQAAAEKLSKNGISSHSVALYAHDKEAETAFFTYGFGLRCVDAVRPLETLKTPAPQGFTLRAVPQSEAALLRPLRKALSEHLSKSPCFMYTPPESYNRWLERAEARDSGLYAAFYGGAPVAFLEVGEDGENFATEAPRMKNICGAYCMPAFRGKGVMQGLLSYTMDTLKALGNTRLGVDFESINPNAYGFWLKHFTAYTHGVVRRIDEDVFAALSPDAT